MVKEVLLVPLFEKFIRETKNGKRRKMNGEHIKPQTIKNYCYVLRLLIEYEDHRKITLRVRINIQNNHKLMIQETKYWKDFYRRFSDFLYDHKNCFDNFAGSVFKNIKCFFRYLKNEKYLAIQYGIENFYVKKENIRIISSLPRQLCFLILDKDFEQQLPPAKRRYKDMFVFGCTAALRFSDLMRLCVKDIEYKCGQYYLVFRSVKTETPVTIKLPEFAVNIFKKFAGKKAPYQKLFPPLAKINFNKQLGWLGERAGWTEITSRIRTRNGIVEEIKTSCGKMYHFYDQLSSHVMRRTGITVLLMLGMPEYMVRKISGHAAHSKEFFRYVNFAESFITDEIDKVHQKLLMEMSE